MLAKKDENLLRRYALLPDVLKVSGIMIAGIFVLYFFLNYLGYNLLDINFYDSITLIALVLILFFYVLLIIISAIIMALSKRNERWLKIVSGLERVGISKYIDDDDNDLSLADIAKAKSNYERNISIKNIDSLSDEAYHALEVYDAKMPNPFRLRLLLIIIPSLLLTASFIPDYINAYSRAHASREVCIEVLDELLETFEDQSYYVSYDDPSDEYLEYGYYFTAYSSSDYDSYISINYDNEGIIDYVSYNIELDINETKEFNLEYIDFILSSYHDLLSSCDLKNQTYDYAMDPSLPQSFIDAFLEGDNYSDLSMSFNDYHVSFYVTEFDNYSYANLYISLSFY